MSFSIGIVGATGVTGEVTLRILEERSFPIKELRLFASRRSAGRAIRWLDRDWTIEALDDGHFDGLDLVISATDASIAREQAPRMVEAGAIVIDQSSAFRLDQSVPLVMPEINGADLESHRGIISGPNCTTAVAAMALAPLQRAVGIESIISSSYQSISGRGRDGIAEFLDLSRKAVEQPDALRGHESLALLEAQQFPKLPAFNVFPQCESFLEGSDISTEEEKMEAEMRKMFHAPELLVHATAVRVPVLVGHSVSLGMSLRRETSPEEAREYLSGFPGIRVVDRPWEGEYPTPIDSAGIDEVLVGRVRSLPSLENGLSLFACGDNLRKGNALNAVQVAERVLGIA
ncbi:MAG: aspartate-semialdehyde dehydrogenase [Myxococcota bacterium]|jgi:aspartate-semialdehyde dehydrogenase|nr:aspartate-semialdehyde dehydrogenase [Deltaproteobacteria bacterium]MCP4239779.1 aspartate-semialdehyde dehydrogenase [bacterium]MDP6074496.1 aspartate-semialdehyde dehydrogenase [Myxococcota bacterium]MDP6241742.1 aspartate-semialdehyde dehydrogenase [Myxococcota bacterium]MDP7073881.1 aspartate-semialdehyde dehydrogenase [Myxococcota bacterium]